LSSGWKWALVLCDEPKEQTSYLARYEAVNAVMSINNEEEAEITVPDFAVAWAARSAFFMGAFHQVTHGFVAQIYIGVVNWYQPGFELGYFVDVDHDGQGYVTEAAEAALGLIFSQLGAARVRLECDDTNSRSYRVAERCGMIKEGHIRANKRNADGSLTGTLLYGLLRKEFFALKEQSQEEM
jgi:[ribosomal protein S5]-alanine N-acetyltransferase